MDDFIEITEISDSRMDFGGDKSVNFGGGLELLMNDKVKNGGSKSSGNLDLEDLNNLELELDNLADDTANSLFGAEETKPITNKSKEPMFNINVNKTLGEATAGSEYNDAKTWDGYSKLNTPINPDKPFVPPESIRSSEDIMMEKFKLLKKIETLEKKGVEFSKKYNMESSLAEMQGEYDTIMEEKSKQASIKFQANMMLSVVNGIEFLNGKFDPFDINLDGWSEQVNDNINDYDDIFGELYDMYKDNTKVSPWLRLMFQLGGSGLMVHMTNTMFKSAMPNMDDVLRQNPDLMRQFQNAAVNSMGQSNPGFAGFMNGVMNGGMGMNGGNNGGATPSVSSPPHSNPEFLAQSRGGNNVYGAMNSNSSYTMPPPPPHNPHSENYRSPRPPPSGGRPEMKGPSDINDILSGLKTKNVNMSPPPPPISTKTQQPQNININDTSIISVNDISDLHGEGTAPKRSKRKPKSDKNNTLSLSL